MAERTADRAAGPADRVARASAEEDASAVNAATGQSPAQERTAKGVRGGCRASA